MPFMLVGTGPRGSGTFGRCASSALSRMEQVGLVGGLHLAAELLHVRTSLGSGT